MPYANPEERRAYCRKRYAEDPVFKAKALERSKNRNKLKQNEYRRRWRQTLKGKEASNRDQQIFLRRYPFATASRCSLWRARKKKTETEKIDHATVIAKANGLCQICDKPFNSEKPQIDHIIPLSKGGTHTYDNVQATHARCNRIKWAHLLEGKR